MMKEITRSHRLVALGFVAALPLGALLFSGALTAQQPPPPPTDKPPTDPHAACCEKMAPGGLTIAGPGTAMATPEGRRDFFYEARSALQAVCVTAENTSTFVAEVTLREDDTPHHIGPGAVRSICQRTAYISLRCPDGPCQIRWRVDRALN